MNPPLHDVALLYQRAKSLAWLCPRRWSSVSATTLLAFGVYISVWYPAAQARSGNLDQADPLIAVQSEKTKASTAEVNYEIGSGRDNLQEIVSSGYENDSTNQLNPESLIDNSIEQADTTSLIDLDNLSRQQQTRQDPTADSPVSPSLKSEFLEQTQLGSADAAVAQSPDATQNPNPESNSSQDRAPISQSSKDLGEPLVQVQGVYTLQGEESSGRARVTASYAITPNLLVGGTVDVTGGNAFSDSPQEGFDLNELYVAVSPSELPNLRFVVGMLDLTSYFDRNSFAKDAATQFLNPVFQSNPALAAAGLGSRPAILMNWTVADPLEIKVAGFSSDRDLGDFALDGFAGEVALRLDNFILRGTYITDRDAGQNDGFREIYGLRRGSEFGLDSDDREMAYGINAEYFIPEINLGLFARYGRYENLDLERGGSTYSLGFNLLDLFMPDDRLGLAYGQELSNDSLRNDRGDDYPDVWELFYDFRITPNLRAGVTLQSSDQFSETIAGFRIRTDFDSSDFGRLFR